jgi:hypothetical protein
VSVVDGPNGLSDGSYMVGFGRNTNERATSWEHCTSSDLNTAMHTAACYGTYHIRNLYEFFLKYQVYLAKLRYLRILKLDLGALRPLQRSGLEQENEELPGLIPAES